MTVDYIRNLEHLGSDMTPQEKTNAIINGALNDIVQLVVLVQELTQRLDTLEKQHEQRPVG